MAHPTFRQMVIIIRHILTSEHVCPNLTSKGLCTSLTFLCICPNGTIKCLSLSKSHKSVSLSQSIISASLSHSQKSVTKSQSHKVLFLFVFQMLTSLSHKSLSLSFPGLKSQCGSILTDCCLNPSVISQCLCLIFRSSWISLTNHCS